mmetsp:Transcript_36321/g.60175  ORF Transcript_36321/g.60175 Transcript_36321/m.60175 type:complete len:106 (+) Transcript_36321:154-471(+)
MAATCHTHVINVHANLFVSFHLQVATSNHRHRQMASPSGGTAASCTTALPAPVNVVYEGTTPFCGVGGRTQLENIVKKSAPQDERQRLGITAIAFSLAHCCYDWA